MFSLLPFDYCIVKDGKPEAVTWQKKKAALSRIPLHHYGSSFQRGIPGFKCHQVIPGFMSQGEIFTRGYASGGEAIQKVKEEGRRGVRSVANAGRSSSASEFQEIMADYVHHEMTRTWVLVLMRLFMIIVIKDVFVSLVFSDSKDEASNMD
ncbi:Peptidyl-prolyl cis-trans isomerase [Heracleum sosnowskyi]|uniref:Peptidyl-prolyl cis-trans isomerase n=1 Tax=Heracleum sosnowskyi TaxID=360622 RepID=A0AAD8II91_9APIA|nr:Peptidyl-prolyl cis-trans isomerase [Heracleum sosnowskyi]